MLRRTAAPFATESGRLGSIGTIVSGLPLAPDTQHLKARRSSTVFASAAENSTPSAPPSRALSLALLSEAIQICAASA